MLFQAFHQAERVLIFYFGSLSRKADSLNFVSTVLGLSCICIMLLQYSLLLLLSEPHFDFACLKLLLT